MAFDHDPLWSFHILCFLLFFDQGLCLQHDIATAKNMRSDRIDIEEMKLQQKEYVIKVWWSEEWMLIIRILKELFVFRILEIPPRSVHNKPYWDSEESKESAKEETEEKDEEGDDERKDGRIRGSVVN